MRASLSLLALAATLLAAPVAAAPAGPHEAMPMLAEPAADKSADQPAADFGKAYEQASRPRIAVYYNRELSGQLEEWITPFRQKNTRLGTYGKSFQGENYTQIRDFNESLRAEPDENWSWAFEDGFYTTLLNERVRLIDRTAILRLAANDRPEADSKDKPDVHIETIPLKRVEIDALKKHADLVVEVLVARGSDASGYEFKAKVLEIKSGRLLALVNQVPDKDAKDEVKGKFVAGPNGYEREQVPVANEAKAKGERLAKEVMNRLAGIWKQ